MWGPKIRDSGAAARAYRRYKPRAVQAMRELAWRALGTPTNAPPDTSPGAPPAPSPTPSAARRSSPPPAAEKAGGQTDPAGPSRKPANPWRSLRRHGLRVERGLAIYTAREIRVDFEAPAQLNDAPLHIYDDVRIGQYSYLRSGIVRHVREIGRYTSIGPHVIIGEAEHPTEWLTTSPAVFFARRYAFYPPEADAVERVIARTDDNTDPTTRQPAVIGNDVWIGANAVIRRGVTIGDGAIVAAGAFVNRNVAPYSVVGGLPARVIGRRFDDATIERLLALRWWEFDVHDLAGIDFSDIDGAISAIQEAEHAKKIRRAGPRYSSVVLGKRGYAHLRVHAVSREQATMRLRRRKQATG